MDIFGTYLALTVLLITLLAMNISRLRMKEQIANGDGKNIALIKAIRAHINSLEHLLPYSLLLFVMKDYVLETAYFSLLCFGFLAVRIVHSYSMLTARFRLRQVTAGLSYLFEVVACFSLLYHTAI